MFARSSEKRAARSKTIAFPAPTKGWVQSGNIVTAGLDQAEVLDNFFVTAQGARLRGGCVRHADLGESVVSLFTYTSGNTEVLFGATGTDIYDASDVGGGAVRASQTSGDFSTAKMSTAGGEFLVGVNGSDTGFTYNGTTFSDLALTGVSEDAVSQVWNFKERLFFVEKDTPSVWYLATESIGGTATEINLGSVFNDGGNVLFGATWSLDSGAGLDDVCLFVSTNGEIAVYEGTNPSSASTWGLIGVYKVAPPLNKNGHFRAGGDLAIMTEDGIIPVSEALRKDRGALQASAITYPIEDAWKSAIANREIEYPVSATLWQGQTLLLIGTPQKIGGVPVSFAANARTGGWSRVLGWDVRCGAVFDDKLYFGADNGKIYRADEGGSDDGVQFTAAYVPKFAAMTDFCSANVAGITYRSTEELTFDLSAHGDYEVQAIGTPENTMTQSSDVWGTGVWGTFIWGNANSTKTFTEWQAAYANGYSLAPGVALSINQTAAVVFEILTTRLRYEQGYPL